MLLHGLAGSGRYWGGAFDRLAGGRRLVVPDLLGFGRSDTPVAGYSPDDHAREVVTALEELGVERAATVGAHSMGVIVALRMAILRPDLVSAVVGFGPPIYADRSSARRRIGRSGGLARLATVTGPLAEASCRWVCDHRDLASRLAQWTHPGLPPEVARDGVAHTWHSYSQSLEQVILSARAGSWLPSVQASVHLVAGRSDRIVDRAHLADLASHQSGLVLETWEGGHNLPLSQPDRCAALIAQVADRSRGI